MVHSLHLEELPLCLRVHTPTDPTLMTASPPVDSSHRRRLISAFWQRFCREWLKTGRCNYNPDLLGCGRVICLMLHTNRLGSAVATLLRRWCKTCDCGGAGALLPVAIALVHLQAMLQKRNKLVRGLVLAGPPAWAVITRIRLGSKKLIWNSRFSFR